MASFGENLYIRKNFDGVIFPQQKKDLSLHNHRADASTNVEAAADVEAPTIPIQAAGIHFWFGGEGEAMWSMCFFWGVGWGGGCGRCLGDFFCCMFSALKSVLGKGYVNSHKRTYCKNISAGADEVLSCSHP